MWISHITLVNWGNIPNKEYHFGRISLLCGGSGTGKTTLGDALQTVFTGAKQGLYSYNPGQDESNQFRKKGKIPRTIQSYALGAEEGNIFSRPNGSHTYVAATFVSDPNEIPAPSFTAVVGISARLTESGKGTRRQRAPVPEELCLMIIDGQELLLNDFLGYQDDPDRVIPVEEVYNIFKRTFGEGCIYCSGHHKENYLKRLYGRLRGAKTAQGSEHLIAAKAFSRFMAYKPIESVSEFVREQILEPKKEMGESVEKISRLMSNVFELRAESKRLAENISYLKLAKRYGEAWKKQYQGNIESNYVAKLVALLIAEKTISDSDGQIEEWDAKAKEATRQAGLSKDEASRLNTERTRISGELTKNEIAIQKESLEKEFNAAALDYAAHRNFASTGIESASATVEILREVSTVHVDVAGHPLVAPKINQLIDLSGQTSPFDVGTITALLERLTKGMTEIDHDAIAQLVKITGNLDLLLKRTFKIASSDDGGLRDQANKLLEHLSLEKKTLDAEIESLSKDITALQKNTVNYPDEVRKALQLITEKFPDKPAPVVLCDLVEVRNAAWQSPIEAYIGGSRFNIVVDDSIEAEAAELVRKMGSKKRGAKVVQGVLARKDVEHLPDNPNSIISELIVTHPVAKAYLKANYGQVVKVKTMAELTKTRRGLTENGMGSGSYAMYPCSIPDELLVFGQKARVRAIASLQFKLSQKKTDIQHLEDCLSGTNKLVSLSRKISDSTVELHVKKMQSASAQIAKVNDSLNSLDLSSIEEIIAKIELLKRQENQAWQNYESNTQSAANLQSQITSQQEKIKELRGNLINLNADVINTKQSLVEISHYDPEYEYENRLTTIVGEAKEQIEKQRKDTDAFIRAENYRKRRGEFINQVLEYNKIARQPEQVSVPNEIHMSTNFNTEVFTLHMRIFSEITRQLRNQERIGLAEASCSLEDAQKNVQDIFTSDFCTMILGAIKEGQKHLDKLSLELKGHTFGDDRFEFASEWVPAYQKYYRFFKAVSEMTSVGEGDSLFGTNLTDDQCEARDEIINLLTCESGENAEKDIALAKKRLEEITDYRNYKTYEIFKIGPNGPNALSEYGTGSGGQLETPAYIVRSASITSSFRIGVSRQSLKVLLIDESFSKCDEFRAKQVIEYLAQSLGIQVIFIMPTKSAGPFFDIIDQKTVFSKILSPSTALGELNTVVHVDSQKVNHKLVKDLWERHRSFVAQQAAIEFDTSLAEGFTIG